ncbi:tissue factor pathway inhibitor a [Genypterus blacodes]|uniref:tissue factor pathway inhibitor a n=1 Tax=Genypterus blacodes TaxID=154954 RepID=UPI003F77048F
MKFSSKLYFSPWSSMAQINKWTLCALSLCCAAWTGSAHTGAHGTPPELFIFNELCALKDEPGPCKAIKERFFFNIDTGRCDHFVYGGCGGNANNFQTLGECEEMCVVSADKDPCHLDAAPGPCRGLVKRFFYDRKASECKRFYYGGCFGNANNFRTIAQCQERCQNPDKVTTAPQVVTQALPQPTMLTDELAAGQHQAHLNTTEKQTAVFRTPEFCFSPVDIGPCDSKDKRFAYNPTTRKCHLFLYSGCEGNKNNFHSRRVCMKKCMNARIKHQGSKIIRIKKKNIGNIVFRRF